MRIAFRLGEADLDLELAIASTDSTVADVASALADGPLPAEVGLLVDGAFAPPSWPVSDAGLREGSRVDLATGPTPASAPAPLELCVVGGLAGGERFGLDRGTHVIGRQRGCAVTVPATTVSNRHAQLDVADDGGVTISDLNSTNGTRVDGGFVTTPQRLTPHGLVQVGAVQLSCGPTNAGDHAVVGRPGPHGLAAFNRPPRGLPPATPAPVRLPSAPGEVRGANRFGWAAVLAPIVVGITLAVLWDPRMAFFALFSPVMMVGNWIEDRRRVKRERRDGGRKYQQRLREAADALAAARTMERRRLFAVLPDVAEVQRRAEGPSNRVWERRPNHDDFLRLRLGVADVPWTPPLAERDYNDRPAEVDALLAEHGVLEQAPVAMDLGAGRCLGLVGPRPVALALLRSLTCQTATHHGPADVRVAVLTEGARADDWDWVKWLPHTRSLDEASGRRLLGATCADVDAVLAELRARPSDDGRPTFGLGADIRPGGPTTLLVIDVDGLTEGRNAPARDLLAGAGRPVAGVVLAPSADRLPAACTSVMTLQGSDGQARYEEPAHGLRLDHVLVAGMTERSARDTARALARLEDPEVPAAGGNLPDTVALLDLLGIERPTAEDLLSRWHAVDTVPRIAAPIGVTERGPMVLDLVADGPHGLVAGTTGSGKSELLRSLVASLAASVSPRHLNFVLVDYKGGSAFDACADLPHTVGLVTDLDEHLGRRALRCLEAELHYRERRLRDAGASDLTEYLLAGNAEPLPRLLVVMDEFAAIAAELPDFVDRLVDVAQRGRSLGVHLLLATQRPTGVVNDHIKANTNLRMSLRVQDTGDSIDVIGGPSAASIGRSQAGRGFVRLGPGELLPFQAALSTGTTARSQVGAVEVRPFTFGARPCERISAAIDDDEGQSDLELLVAAAGAAALTGGIDAPRRPWLEPLADRLVLDELVEHAERQNVSKEVCAPIGMVDEPDHQRQQPFWWDAAHGHLLLYGVAGSGTTTALATLAVSLARSHTPAEVHLYVLDFGTGALSPLADLPHVGAVVGAGERDRQVRLIRQLRGDLERRRRLVADTGALGRDVPAVVLLLDNYGGFTAAFDDFAGNEVREQLQRVIADGAGLGMYVVFTADRVNAVPSGVSTLVPEKLAFRLGDRYDYGAFGLPTKEVPKLGPGRCLHVESHLEVQIALPGPGDLADAVTRCAVRSGTATTNVAPPPVGSLPKDVKLVDVAGAAGLDAEDWLLPVGIGDTDLAPVGFRLGHGDHALVTGPARSGKSSTLAVLAELAAASRPDVRVTAVAFRRSALRESPAVHRLVTDASEIDDALTAVANDAAPQLVLIDDADLNDDPTQAIAQLLGLRRPDVHVIAAGRADALRTNYSHWTVEVRRSRQGFALRPEDMDTELWNVTLPRHRPVHLETGRGYLVADGRAELTQGARP